MSLSKDDLNLFGLTVTAHESAYGAEYYVLNEDIYVVELPEYKIVGSEVVQFGYDFLTKYNVGAHHCIFILNTFTDIPNEVRNWAADKLKSRYTLSDAIVLKDSSQRILADFYQKQQQPAWPTKFFFSFDEAIQWSIEQKKG